jgi:uncharacterized protein (TIGR03790 family)
MKDIVAFFERFCIAEHQTACRHWALAAGLLVAFAGLTQAQTPAAVSAPSAAAASAPQWVVVPRATGRLRAPDIGLVINSADPYSVAVGAYYQQRRGLRPEQVLRLELPLQGTLKPEEFEALRAAIDAHFGPDTQALALAWSQPYAVECNSITGALALGFDADLCRQSCAPSRVSAYANSASARPLRDHGMRLSMLLAARDVEAARRLIDRGVAADRTLGLRGAPPSQVYFLTTPDGARNVRARLYPPAGPQPRAVVQVQVQAAADWNDTRRALLVQTGSVRLPTVEGIEWLDGGLGDHLTSFGGRLGRDTGQATALDWIGSGATASHGAVSEPCNHLQKFPHPQWLLLHYLQGSTAIEAYWKSVLWPQQSLFVGEPLAAPFARR